jgi:hypothetical protein
MTQEETNFMWTPEGHTRDLAFNALRVAEIHFFTRGRETEGVENLKPYSQGRINGPLANISSIALINELRYRLYHLNNKGQANDF